MTIREKLEDMRRKAGTVAMIGWPVCAAGVVLALTVNVAFVLVCLLGFILLGGGVFCMVRGIRCPRWRGPIGHAISYPRKGLFGVSKKIQFCPFCGVSLDSELTEQEGPTDQAT